MTVNTCKCRNISDGLIFDYLNDATLIVIKEQSHHVPSAFYKGQRSC